MKFGRLLACSLMALTLAAPTAYAQDAGEEDLGELTSPRPRKKTAAEEENTAPDRTGVYLGVGGSYNIEDFDVGGFGNGFGFNVRAGRRMHPRVALELEIEKFSGFDGNGAEYDAWQMGVNAKGFVLTGKWQPFVLAGLGFAHGEVTQNNLPPGPANPKATEDFAMRFGGGLDWYFMDHVLATVDITYLVHAGDLSDFNVASLSWGIQYRP